MGDRRAITTSIVGTVAWVTVHSDLDLASVAEVELALTNAAARSKHYVFVDLTDVTFIDAAGIGAIVRAATALNAKGRRLKLLGASDKVQHLLDITGMSAHLGIERNLLDQTEKQNMRPLVARHDTASAGLAPQASPLTIVRH